MELLKNHAKPVREPNKPRNVWALWAILSSKGIRNYVFAIQQFDKQTAPEFQDMNWQFRILLTY
jgi:hypothetical protein